MPLESLNVTIRRKLMTLVLVPCLVFIVGLGAFVGYEKYTSVTERNRMLAEALGQYVTAYLQEAEYALRHISLVEAGKIHEEDITEHIAHMYASFPQFERFLMLDRNADIITAYPSGLAGLDFPFLFTDNKPGTMSKPLYSAETERLIIYMSHPTAHEGRIVGELGLEALRSHLLQFAPTLGSTFIILTDDFGNLIVHPDESQIRQQTNIGGWDLFQDNNQSGYSLLIHSLNGQRHLGSIYSMPDIGWRLILSTPLGAIFYPLAQTIVGVIIFLAAFFAIIATTFHFELHRRVVTPLSRFASALQDAAKGQYKADEKTTRGTFAELEVMENEFISMARTINGREQELRRSQNHLKSIMDSLSTALLSVDKNARITLMNTAAEQLSGMKRDQGRGQDVYEAFPMLDQARKHLTAALTMHRSSMAERLPGGSKGRTAYYDIACFPLQDEHEGGAVVRIEDVTTRQQLEEIMIQTEKMMSVGGLAAGMAHEINNPLGGILQSAQNINRRIDPKLPPNIKAAEELGVNLDSMRSYMENRGIFKMLTSITESGQRAASIVSNMLDFSRRSSSSLAPCDIHALIENVLNLASNEYDLKKRYDFRKINILRKYDPNIPSIGCTSTEIEQVVLNLFKNAAQAMNSMDPPPDSPTLSITTKAGDGHIEIRIQDNGPGIDKDTRKRIFEPFFTTKEPGEGTGLGLSVSYFIITNNHKGSFTVNSAPGQGAEFIIRLPIQQAC